MSNKKLRELDRQFYQDACILEAALDREKGLPRRPVKQQIRNGSIIVESAEVVNQNAAQLTNKAKELRNTTDATFKQIVTHWEKQVGDLEKELEIYRNKKNTGQTRVEKRNIEIENLRADNARIAGLLERCETRISEMVNYKSSESDERTKSKLLSDQIYDAKKMKVDLKKRIVDAERLLAQTKSEKRELVEENRVLKGATAELRYKLKESNKDTRETRKELEMIESMIKSVDKIDQDENKQTLLERSTSSLTRAFSAIFGGET